MLRYEPPELRDLAERYAALDLQPLRVSVFLSSPVHAPDPPALDSILAAAVVREVYQGSLIPDVPAGYSPDVPAPLQVLWRDEQGFPLYACSEMLPVGEALSDVTYHHKRHQTGRFTQRTKSGLFFSVKPTDGRWMDRQRPLTTIIAEALSCAVMGNMDEIERLLRQVTHIGKERGRGMGRIRSWHIEPLGGPFELVAGGQLTRNIPTSAAAQLGVDVHGQGATLGAWTAPRWQNGLYSLIYPAGTKALSTTHH